MPDIVLRALNIYSIAFEKALSLFNAVMFAHVLFENSSFPASTLQCICFFFFLQICSRRGQHRLFVLDVVVISKRKQYLLAYFPTNGEIWKSFIGLILNYKID
jgi:hypothetical protein